MSYKLGSDTNENVGFEGLATDHAAGHPTASDPTRLLSKTDTSLDNFFKRPVKIRSYEWTTAAAFDQNFDPWSNYINNPRVANRISNYYNLKGTLKIRILINGNPFLYGRLMASYVPLDIWDYSVSQENEVGYLTRLSQCPKVFIDPTRSEGGEMTLPFFYFKDMVNLTDGDYGQLGQIYIKSLGDLNHSNGTVDEAQISVFAWMEDVELSGLTHTNMLGLTPQADETDMANKGAISRPATALAGIAGVMANIPPIRPFALATQMAASGIASMAALLGYSAPVMTKSPDRYKPVLASNFAVTDQAVTTEKLTVDSKQELSIDPRISGMGASDPMLINEIATRESYLTNFTWAEGAATESLLWNVRVNPMLGVVDATDSGRFLTALAFASVPFQYWTGTIDFRFQIVASAYHRGRIKVVFDPSRTPLVSEYNVAFTEIIDLSEKDDFTISVSNAQPYGVLKVTSPQLLTSGATSTITSPREREDNGTLSVFVVNKLTSPNETISNDVRVNVFVKAGKDFELFSPGSAMGSLSVTASPQSSETDLEGHVDRNKPDHEDMTHHALGTEGFNSPDLAKVYMGERVCSLRPLTKRWNWHSLLTIIETGAANEYYCTRDFFPYFRGGVTGAVDTRPDLSSVNYCSMTMLNYLVLGYSGFRGSVRYRIKPYGPSFRWNPIAMRVARVVDNNTSDMYLNRTRLWDNSIQLNERRFQDQSEEAGTSNEQMPFDGGRTGNCLMDTSLSTVLEFEVPFQSEFRFVPGKQVNFTTGGSWNTVWGFRVIGRADDDTALHLWASAGEDFQTYFFTGAPKLFYVSDDP
jgi:hypothetical protein